MKEKENLCFREMGTCLFLKGTYIDMTYNYFFGVALTLKFAVP